jgi:hypothetical protein
MTTRAERPGSTGTEGAGAAESRIETAGDALLRAQTHARRAIGEALAALRALLDAASLSVSGRPSDANAALRAISELLDEQSRRLGEGGSGVPAPVMSAILDALDQEIGRWEKRAARDSDARAVLRTFLGLREILWEFGFRREDGTARAPAKEDEKGGEGGKGSAGKSGPDEGRPPKPARPRADGTAPSRRRRIQRVDVQG